MRHTFRKTAAGVAFSLAMLTAAVQPIHAQQTAAPAPVAKHHSKLKGALVGAAAGHVLGGHAKSGAVAGALWQHHKNKKAAKRQ
jgi:hypothetical protein